MSEPEVTTVVIESPKNATPEEHQKYVQYVLQKLAQEKREKEIYERGRRDGRGMISGLLGF